MNKKIFLVIAALALIVPGLVAASTPGEAEIQSETQLSEYEFESSNQSVNVSAGQITELDLFTQQSTYRWAGLFGTTTGSIVLGDDDDNILYNWSATGLAVYASISGSIDWDTLGINTVGNLEADFAFASTGADNIGDTFDSSENFESNILGTINTIRAQTFDNTGSAFWSTFALRDGGDVNVFAGLVASGQSFNDEAVDFQMIVPQDGLNAPSTQYSLWVELQ